MKDDTKVSRAAGTVSGMTLLSRLFGFFRDLVIAMKFGATPAADAFFVAFRIPNVQRRLLGEGAVSAAFIPVFSEVINQKGEGEAWVLSANLFNILTIILTGATLFIIFFAPIVITLFAPGVLNDPYQFNLTVELVRWMAPYLFFIGLAVFCMGILNTYKSFAIPAAAPVMLNISMILAALFLAPNMEEPVFGLAIGVLVGGFLQFIIQLPGILKRGMIFTSSVQWKHPEIIKIWKLMVPAILGLAVYEINILVDTVLASMLPGGSISYLYYGNRLVQLPLGIFGVALGVAILPTLSERASRNEIPELIQTLGFGIRFILFITIPATVGLILLRFPIINTLWERGEFSRMTTDGTCIALLYYSLGLCAFAGIKVIAPAYYSLQDTKTPARIAIYSMILNIVLNLILMGPLKHGGLALATSIAAFFNVFLLIHFLRKRLGLMGGRKILASITKMTGSAAIMGIIVFFLNRGFFAPAAPLVTKLAVLIGCITAGAVTFSFLSKWMKNEEWDFLIDLIQNRKHTP